MVQGRPKGAGFERKLCFLFSTWWGGRFKRVPLSGGWDKSVVTGDIFKVATGGGIDKTFPFSVEGKNQEGWNWNQLFKGVGPVSDWWKQAEDDSIISDLIPLLVFTRAHWPVYIMFEQARLVELSVGPGVPLQTKLPPDYGLPIWFGHKKRVMVWDDFVKTYVRRKEEGG